ncbi:MAG: hypothetical protein IKX31_06280 [Muribaculaceae bacterium]|nr:hypothetical protein [Muribaculaceae bacterium]
MKCINCYREIKDGLKFCNFCGSKQPKDREAYEREHPELKDAIPENEVMKQINETVQEPVFEPQFDQPQTSDLDPIMDQPSIDTPVNTEFSQQSDETPFYPTPVTDPDPTPTRNVAPAPITPVPAPAHINHPKSKLSPITCPVCGAQLSPMASSCFQCGYVFNNDQTMMAPRPEIVAPPVTQGMGNQQINTVNSLTQKANKNKPIIIAVAAVLALAILGGIIYALTSGGSSNHFEVTSTTGTVQQDDEFSVTSGITSTVGAKNGSLLEMGTPIKFSISGSGDLVNITATVTLKRTSASKVNLSPENHKLEISGRDSDNSNVKIILNADHDAKLKILEWLYKPAGTQIEVNFSGTASKYDLEKLNRKATNNNIII